MNRKRIAALSVASLALLLHCASVELLPPRLDVATGPAAGKPIHRVVALPATCGSFDGDSNSKRAAGDGGDYFAAACDVEPLSAINEVLRSALEFDGKNVVDLERVNIVTAERRDVSERRGLRDPTAETTERSGALFFDATPEEQAAILRELSVDGVLSARVWVGASYGFAARRTVQVQVRLMRAEGRELAWVRRCELEMAVANEAQAALRATRCAMNGALGSGEGGAR